MAPAIDWLITAGVVLPCVKAATGQIPLKAFEERASFKLYNADVGLLVQQAEIPKELILQALPNIYLGAVTENYAAQALTSNGFSLHYWTSKQTAEIDFLLQQGVEVIPVEIKRGTKVRSRSLTEYCKNNPVTKALRFSEKNFGKEGILYSMPLYSMFALK